MTKPGGNEIALSIQTRGSVVLDTESPYHLCELQSGKRVETAMGNLHTETRSLDISHETLQWYVSTSNTPTLMILLDPLSLHVLYY